MARRNGLRTGETERKVAVVGAGFAGVGTTIILKRAGYDDVTVFERAERIGGVWHHNTYPGAACDVASHLYEFSFALNPRWSRRYAPQAEIQTYIEDIAARFGVTDRIQTGTDVLSATWDDAKSRWSVETSRGPYEASVLVTGCGQLTVPKMPEIAGLERFEGPTFHTARWNHDVDLRGKRVAVVGTGASAIQVVPALRREVAHLDVYQRSPGWTLPKGDFAYSERTKQLFARCPALQRLERHAWLGFNDLLALAMTRHRWMLKALQAAGRHQITAAISDPQLRAKLMPDYEIGCKRILLTDSWYRTLAQPNVAVVDDPIEEITPSGIRTEDGADRPVDAIVWATGYRAHDFVAPMQIVGRDGRTLADAWADGPRAYLGMSVPGFPNMFFVHGPNTTGGSGSVVNTIECGVRHVMAALAALESAGADRIELTQAAADRFDRELRTALAETVWHAGGCGNWYLGADGFDPVLWPWTWRTYASRTARLEPGAYALSSSERPSSPTSPLKASVAT